MPAPLGFFLLTQLATCTLFLLICWVHDADGTAIKAGRESGDLGVPRPSSQKDIPCQTSSADIS
jgi:hypothetical protein